MWHTGVRIVGEGWRGHVHLLGNILLGIGVFALWGVVWFIPFRKDIYRWYDERWGR